MDYGINPLAPPSPPTSRLLAHRPQRIWPGSRLNWSFRWRYVMLNIFDSFKTVVSMVPARHRKDLQRICWDFWAKQCSILSVSLHFQRFDANKDGKLSRAEFQRLMESRKWSSALVKTDQHSSKLISNHLKWSAFIKSDHQHSSKLIIIFHQKWSVFIKTDHKIKHYSSKLIIIHQKWSLFIELYISFRSNCDSILID